MGIMVTYGSYVKDHENMNASISQIEICDTIVAFLAAVMIIPAVYTFMGDAGLENSGPGLIIVCASSEILRGSFVPVTGGTGAGFQRYEKPAPAVFLALSAQDACISARLLLQCLKRELMNGAFVSLRV